LGSEAAQNTQISGIFPFPLEGEGVRGWGALTLSPPGKAAGVLRIPAEQGEDEVYSMRFGDWLRVRPGDRRGEGGLIWLGAGHHI